MLAGKRQAQCADRCFKGELASICPDIGYAILAHHTGAGCKHILQELLIPLPRPESALPRTVCRCGQNGPAQQPEAQPLVVMVVRYVVIRRRREKEINLSRVVLAPSRNHTLQLRHAVTKVYRGVAKSRPTLVVSPLNPFLKEGNRIKIWRS